MRTLIWFTLGVAAGAVGTYYLVRESYDTLAQELDDLMEEYEVLLGKKKEVSSEDQEIQNVEDLPNDDVSDSGIVKKLVRRYDMMGSHLEEVEAPVHHPVDSDESEYAPPYIITDDEFAEDRGFDKVTIYYYTDDVLAEDTDDMIDDRFSLIGDHLQSFGINSGDDDVVFVRNEALDIDFEVIRQNFSYQEHMTIGEGSGKND